MSLVSIFATALLPIVVVAAVGFLLGRVRDVDPEPLNEITVYVLAPALVVHSLAATELGDATLGRLFLALVSFTLVMLVVSGGLARLLGEREPLLGGIVLVASFPNTGNFGIPLADFAFGPTGRSTAVLLTVVQGVLLYTVGVYVAARGGDEDAFASMKRVFALPLVYAVLLALGARWLGVVPPTDSTVMQTLELVGNAAIPVMILILGVQLSNVRMEGSVGRVGLASGLKLLLAPAVALGVALLIGFENDTVARVFVLLASAPTAVTAIILVGAFGGDADGITAGQFVSAAVLVTSLASVVTVTALVALLQSGALL